MKVFRLVYQNHGQLKRMAREILEGVLGFPDGGLRTRPVPEAPAPVPLVRRSPEPQTERVARRCRV